VGVSGTATAIAGRVEVGSLVGTGVDRARHCVLVALKHVVLGAEVAIDLVGIAVVSASVTGEGTVVRVIARHADEGGGGIARAANLTHVDVIAEALSDEVGLPVAVRSEPVTIFDCKLESTTSVADSDAVVSDFDVSCAPVGPNNADLLFLSINVDVCVSIVLSECLSNEQESCCVFG